MLPWSGQHSYPVLKVSSTNHTSLGCHVRDAPKQQFLHILDQLESILRFKMSIQGKKGWANVAMD